MPMREECKFFESRTYANGETVRKCDLDLAPEAPWRCPEDCQAFEPRLADVNWTHGTLVTPPTPAEPPGLDASDDDIASSSTRPRTSSTPPGPRCWPRSQAADRRQRPSWRRIVSRGRVSDAPSSVSAVRLSRPSVSWLTWLGRADFSYRW